ncbi:MAG: T9SS type A sorting domain-containing protein [Paludibacter sp.]
MRKTNFVTLTFLCLLVFNISLAQTNLILKFKDGTEKSTSLSSLDKLTFSQNNLVLNYQSAGSDSYAVSTVYKLIFGTATTIHQVTDDDESYSFYPNPADQFIFLKNVPEGTVKVSVYKLDGAMIKSIELNSVNEQIDVSQLSSGFYILKINNKALKLTIQ